MSIYNNSPFKLSVHPSGIKMAGLGVFTKQIIPNDTVIGQYDGEIVEGKRIKNPDYTVYVSGKISINAIKTPRCIFAMINDAHNSQFKNNCKFVRSGKKMFIMSTCVIDDNSELFIGYGHQYWQSKS